MSSLLRAFRRRLFRTNSYLLFKASCEIGEHPRLGEGESYLALDSTNIDEFDDIIKALEQLSGDASDYISDVRAGKIVALLIQCNGELVHYSYVFLRNKSACILGLDRDTALVGNVFTVQSYRGKGCQARSVALCAAIARDRGFAFIAAETSLNNVASQRGMKNGGMNLAGRLDLAVILNSLVIRWRRPPGSAMLGFCLCS